MFYIRAIYNDGQEILCEGIDTVISGEYIFKGDEILSMNFGFQFVVFLSGENDHHIISPKGLRALIVKKE